MSVLIGSTIPAFALKAREPQWHRWLDNAEEITFEAGRAGHEVTWLAVLQEDARGREHFAALHSRLAEISKTPIGVGHCWFSIDRGETEIDGGNRLGAICTGRNLIIEYAIQGGQDWIYFADADISAPDDVLPRLLELQWPVCGAHVPTYCLDGPPATEAHYLNYRHSAALRRAGRQGDIRMHWNTAGSLLVARDVFRRVPWRHDPDAGETDDPATQAEMARLGWVTLVRHDVLCTHHPEVIEPVDQRGNDLTVYR